MTPRCFGMSNVRTSLGGKHSPARLRANTPRVSDFFPPQSILHGEDILDPPLDIRRALVGALVGSVTGILFAVSVFVCLFVEIH